MREFRDTNEFINDVILSIESIKETWVTIAADRYITKTILNILLGEYNLDAYYIYFDLYDYFGEYVINIDTDYKLSIEPAARNGTYVRNDSELYFIHEEVSAEFLVNQGNQSKFYLFTIKNEWGECTYETGIF